MRVLFNHFKVHIAFSIWILIFAFTAYKAPLVFVIMTIPLLVAVILWSIGTIFEYMFTKDP